MPVRLDPNIIVSGQVPTGFAGIYDASCLDDHCVALFICPGDVLDTLLDHKHLSFFHRNFLISKSNLHFTLDHDERLVGIVMLMPYKITLKFDEFKLVIIQLSNHLRRPMLRKEGQLLSKIDGVHGNILPDIAALNPNRYPQRWYLDQLPC